ncbi:hypothetical protein L1049_022369 [Liquidambar formosana]|uniref:Uncharacterized protein n=1 Tax=Liquidambar formosana TaxID=63359 RepID=A0AAP0WR63_LIQFO
MVGERGSSSSPSRLSPLAPPFTLDRSTRTPNSSLLPQSQQNSYASLLTPSLQNWHSSSSSPIPTSVLESFSTPTFEYDDSSIAAPLSAYGYLGHHSDSAFQSLPDDHLLETKPYAPHHSSAVFYGTLDFDPSSTSVAIPLDETSPTHYPYSNGMSNGLSYGDRGSFSCEESNGGGASSANMSLLKQGVPATESLHTCLETSASWYGKCTGILGADNQIGSGITGQIDDEYLAFPLGNPNATSSKILTSSVLCSTAIPQEVSELQEPYPALVVNSLGHDNNNTNSYERHTSQIYPYKPNPTVSHSLENNSFLAQVLKSSGDGMNFSESRPVSSVNLISSGNVTVNNNENSSGHTKSSSKRLDVLQNAKGKVVCRDESRIEEGEEIKDYIFVESSTNKDEFSIEKPVPDDVIDPLLVEKSKLRVTLPNLLDDFAYEADEDSPCWKGTLARHSPVEVLGPVNSQPLKNELEACKSLNPFAPQFFPGSGEGSLYYCGNDYCGGDLLAFPKSFSSDVQSLSDEHGLGDAAVAGPCFSKVSSGVEAQCSDRTL